jgi:galactose-1-phosphate uridylyltransferase
MFELWAKRKDTGQYELICSYQDYENEKHNSMLDELDNGEYEEAIILRDKFYVLMKIYEKGKVLKK